MFLAMTVLGGAIARAQVPLTLAEAMTRARTATPQARALDAGVEEAADRVRQARVGYFPQVDVIESYQRGNQPVFVFGSLLSQRRFTTANFAIDELNRPSAMNNVRTGITIQQPIFDAGLTRLAVSGAELNREMAAESRNGTGQDLAQAAATAFVRVLQLEADEHASEAAVAASESDLQRARSRRDAGLVTDADVLAVQVHVADMRQRHIATTADLAVARIRLSEAIGAPLGESVTPARPARPAQQRPIDVLVRDALASRSERRAADLRVRLASSMRSAATAAFLPRFDVEAGWESNGSRPSDQRSSWIVGGQVQVNLFRGLGDVARMAEARHGEMRAEAERERVARTIEVEVRAAVAHLEAARAREVANQAALAQARESQRIVRDRYESGLATITDVLRAAEAVLDAESRATAAEMDVVIHAVSLDRATGRL